jgi:glycosyltransferase involved in cell wall biosynthesis
MYEFLYVGRLSVRQKRADLLLDFCYKLTDANINFTFDIFGKGDKNIEDELARLERITLHGHVSSWPKALKKKAIYFSPSDYEGCPLSLLEFHKYGGRNVLVANKNGLRQYVSEACLFESIDEAVSKITHGEICDNQVNLGHFFDKKLSKTQIRAIVAAV